MTAAAAVASRIERLQALYAAIEEGDRERFRARIDEVMHVDCVWEPLIAAVEGGRYVGRDGMVAFFEDFLGSFEVRYVDPEFRPVGERAVVLLVTMKLRGRESGVAFPGELGVTFEFDGALVRRARAYDSHAAALADAEALDA